MAPSCVCYVVGLGDRAHEHRCHGEVTRVLRHRTLDVMALSRMSSVGLGDGTQTRDMDVTVKSCMCSDMDMGLSSIVTHVLGHGTKDMAAPSHMCLDVGFDEMGCRQRTSWHYHVCARIWDLEHDSTMTRVDVLLGDTGHRHETWMSQ